MKTSSAKAKGRKLQQWFAKAMLMTAGNLKPDDIRSTSMGAGGEDIQLSTAARDLFPWSIECKSNKAIAVYRFMEQCEANAPKGCEPVVVIKENRKQPLVVVDAEYFLDMQWRLNLKEN